MTVTKLNPDSMLLSQLEGQWQKLFMMLLWKLKRGEKITLTGADMREFSEHWGKLGGATLFTHGHVDSIDFKLITPEEALRIAAHERQMTGGMQ